MNIEDYFTKMKNIQIKIMDFIDSSDNVEEKFDNFINLIYDEKILQDTIKFRSILQLLSSVIKHHHREPYFFDKIQKILIFLSKEIKQTFTNSEIFNIFKNNKVILLFLIEENIITIDESISKIITDKKYKLRNYPEFFFNEIKQFIGEDLIEKIKNKIPRINYEENRKIGENESDICKLIREDLIEEFIIHANKTDLALSKTIEPSIFESNSIFFYKNPTLIEYSAFYGSVQIFKYLFLNHVEVTKSIWIYAIHGNNPELISFLEDNYNELDNLDIRNNLEESIKCHHYEISDYIINKLNDNDEVVNENNYENNIFSYGFHYHNFLYFPTDPNYEFIFYYACQYNYYDIVKYYLLNKDIDINKPVIFHIIFK